MDLAFILGNLEIVASGNNGVQRLRELILKLAIQGLLVEQQVGEGNAIKDLHGVEESEVRERLQSDSIQSADLPQNWALASFPNIGQWIGGNGFPTVEQGHKDKEILFCKVSDMNLPANQKYINETIHTIDNQTAKRLRVTVLTKGTVVFPKIGGAIATNKRRIIIKPTVVDNNCMGIKPCSAIDTEWLYLLLSSIDMAKYQSGTSIPSLSQRILDQIYFGVPPLGEQKRIVERVTQLLSLCDQLEGILLQSSELNMAACSSIIDKVSTAQTEEEIDVAWERIQNNWEMIANTPESLEKIKTLILDLAVRGDLGLAEIRGESQIIEWSASELKLDPSKLWNLPTLRENKKEGWNRIPLAKVGTWGSGGTPTSTRKEYYKDGTIPWAVIGDLNNETMTSTETKITEQALQASSSKIIPVGAVLIAMYGASIGKTAISGIECCTNQAIAHCIVDKTIVSTEYFFLVAKSLKRYLIQEGKGAAQPNISQSVLKHLIIDLPPLGEQELIVHKVDSLFQLCDELGKSIAIAENIAEKFARSLAATVVA